MTTIRPDLYPQPQPRPQGQDGGKLAAQRAFFDALSQARGAAPTTSTAAAQPAAAAPAPNTVQRTTAVTPDEAPSRILRPGSLFDIRV